MDFIHVFFQWIFIFTLTVGLSPPQNVNIKIKGNNVTITWTLSSDPGEYTYLNFKNAAGTNVFGKYTRGTSYTTTVLSRCQQYTVSLQSVNTRTRSDPVNIQFWTTELSPPKNVNIMMKDKNVHFSWTLPSKPVTATYLEVYNGSGIGTQKVISDEVLIPRNVYTLSSLLPCHQYTVKLQSRNHSVRSEAVEKTFWTAELSPPKDVDILIKSKNVTLSWTLPTDPITATYLEVHNSNDTGAQKVISVTVLSPKSSYALSDLLTCQQYTVKLQSGNHSVRSEVVEKTFSKTEFALNGLQFKKGKMNFQDYNTAFEFDEEEQVFVKMEIVSCFSPLLYLYSESFRKQELKYNLNNNFYTAKLPSLKCEQSDPYTIEVNNDKNSTNRNVQLVVHCTPKNIIPERRTIGTHIGVLENVTIYVVANPEPSVEWITDTGFSWKREQTSTRFKYKLMSHAKIEDKSKYGQYGVKIYNSGGSTTVYITLSEEVAPASVSVVAIICGSVGGLVCVIIFAVMWFMYYRNHNSNSVVEQENRKETDNEGYVALNRTGQQTDCHNGT